MFQLDCRRLLKCNPLIQLERRQSQMPTLNWDMQLGATRDRNFSRSINGLNLFVNLCAFYGVPPTY